LPEVAPGELILSSMPGSFEGAPPIDFARLGALVADRQDLDGQRIVLADSDGDLHVWLRENLHGEALCPAVILPVDQDFPLRFAVAGRFYRRLSRGRADLLPRNLRLTQQRRARLVLLLHVLDARAAGATPRGIATAFLDPQAATLPSLEWKSSALRRKANRLITEALVLRDGGYLKLLRGIWPLSND